jgi:AraC-like DNA-binding protein
MSHYKNELEKLCKLVFTLSNIDTSFVDSSSEINIEYGHNNVPESLKIYLGNTIKNLELNDKKNDSKVLFHVNSWRINYISAKIYDSDKYLGSLIIGPYLLEEPIDLMLQDILHTNSISISLGHIMKQYYLSLPLISTYKAKMLAELLFIIIANFKSLCIDNPNIGEMNYNFYTESLPTHEKIKQSSELSMALLEERYSKENKLTFAVENGDLENLDKYLKEDLPLFSKIPDRIPNDPLRSRKNLSFVWNTLLRVAAKKGGVHPVNLHALSEKFAIQIEKTSSIQELMDLQIKMALGYCEAVKKLSLKNYNYLVREAIEYIRINIDEDLSLEVISNAINASPFELSRKFKKETKQTITNYINKLRIKEAVRILENENISITEIAEMVGFNDVNYFTKVFKKINSITPSEYRKNKK